MNKQVLLQGCDWTLLKLLRGLAATSVTQWSVPLNQAHIPLTALAAEANLNVLKDLCNMQLYSELQLYWNKCSNGLTGIGLGT